MAKKPLITVIIPAYNEEKLIGRCIEALMRQTLPRDKYEILVIDNNSTDKTSETARLAGAKVIYYDERKGASPSRNYGTLKANGDIIAYTDADSIPRNDWLETAYSLMQNRKFMCLGGQVLPTGKSMIMEFIFSSYNILALVNQIFHISLIWGPNMIVRKKTFMQINGFKSSLKKCEDWDLVMRIQKKFGIESTYYTNRLSVKTSPRRQENILSLFPYLYTGIFNYFFIFILHESYTIGSQKNIR